MHITCITAPLQKNILILYCLPALLTGRRKCLIGYPVHPGSDFTIRCVMCKICRAEPLGQSAFSNVEALVRVLIPFTLQK